MPVNSSLRRSLGGGVVTNSAVVATVVIVVLAVFYGSFGWFKGLGSGSGTGAGDASPSAGQPGSASPIPSQSPASSVDLVIVIDRDTYMLDGRQVGLAEACSRAKVATTGGKHSIVVRRNGSSLVDTEQALKEAFDRDRIQVKWEPPL